ncbi:MAG: hypothetical protein CR984_02675 [Proteobacteria bacterium]|nr:MAG: hypothetical protein CR984_02675 [Pseudomonadota bacterium]PIE68193.1 MAG: hypothetical protein CSA23_00125 [Deltaproteobacteria bacterium]
MQIVANRTWCQASILVVLISLFTGCADMFQRLDDNMHRKRFRSDYETLEKALAAYDRGDYQQAKLLFKGLTSTSASDLYSRKAKLGLICSRLLTAENQDDYTAAVGMWHQFGETKVKANVWDIRLLEPLVVRMTPKTTTRLVYIHPPAEQRKGLHTKQSTLSSGDTQVPPEQLTELKKKAALAAQLQQRIDNIEAENKSLKEKIKALETIDQIIRKKKTEIAAPNE